MCQGIDTTATDKPVDIGFRVTKLQKEEIREKALSCNIPMSSLIKQSVLSQKLIVAGNEKVRQIIIERLKFVGASLQQLVSKGYIDEGLMDEIKIIDGIKNAWK